MKKFLFFAVAFAALAIETAPEAHSQYGPQVSASAQHNDTYTIDQLGRGEIATTIPVAGELILDHEFMYAESLGYIFNRECDQNRLTNPVLISLNSYT